MTITPTTLTRAAGVAAAVAGLLFVGVQINHPHLDVTFVTTNEWVVRSTAKVLMAALALAGITGMYLHQLRPTGILGLVGYLLFTAGYLVIMSIEFVAAYVLPSLVDTSPAYVSDVLAVATGGTATGDIGLMQTANLVAGIGYLAGGLVFGIALFRARVLARWAAALLALGAVATLAVPVLPTTLDRILAVPTGVALVGLGYSLWRTARTDTTTLLATVRSPHVTTAGAE